MGRIVLAVLVLSACTSRALDDEPDPEQPVCTRLRDHLIDLRLSTAQAVDRISHRAAMQRALGDDFTRQCESELSDDQIHCALAATDLVTAGNCAARPQTTASN